MADKHPAYENITAETRGRVGVVRLNRPQTLNALNAKLVSELSVAIDVFEADDQVGCIVITGSEKAFAAGADIKEMADKSFMDQFLGDFAANYDRARARAQAGDRGGGRIRAWRRLRTCHAM